MVIASEGSYPWQTVYNMPVWLRTFTYNKMKKRFVKSTESSDINQQTLVNPDGTINKQEFKKANENMNGKVSYK